jgi:hypothetical protein
METKRKPIGYWTLERCIESASKHSSKASWRKSKSEASAYHAARRNGWLDQCCDHMLSKSEAITRSLSKWDLESCKEDALRFSTRTEWGLSSGGAYNAAKVNGWVDECCAHMDVLVDNSRTLESCTASALRFSSREDWRRGDVAAYGFAQKRGWMDQCCAHMERAGGTDNDVVYIWRDAGTDLHKIGVTSEKVGEGRIGKCSSGADMDPRIVLMLKVDDARAVEAELLKLGTDPELDSSIDGYTEFRVLTNEELGKAVSTAYQYAVAA